MSDFEFHPEAEAYDPRNALSLGHASDLAYKPEPEVQQQVSDWGFSHVRFFSDNGTQAYFAARNDLQILVFRGTEPQRPEDILTDADCRLITAHGGRVHKGFHDALKSVITPVAAEIRTLPGNSRKLWLTGHSLGGALATLAVIALDTHGIHTDGISTYGQPRSGDAAFARAYRNRSNGRSYRHVNFHDCVTMLPLPIMGYRHVGWEKYFDAQGNLYHELPFYLRLVQLTLCFSRRWLRAQPDLGADHSMSIYLRNLKAQVR